jgi:hypothetical protein
MPMHLLAVPVDVAAGVDVAVELLQENDANDPNDPNADDANDAVP